LAVQLTGRLVAPKRPALPALAQPLLAACPG